jgi:hypothetical protein
MANNTVSKMWSSYSDRAKRNYTRRSNLCFENILWTGNRGSAFDIIALGDSYDLAQATPELLREIEAGLLGVYHAAQPLERHDDFESLGVYSEHFLRRQLLKNKRLWQSR